MRRALAALAVIAPFVLGAASLADAEDGQRAFRLEDPEIVESSGLAFVDDVVVTVNDSGDSGRVFAVDPATGQTVGVTRWTAEPRDIEALAPAGPGLVWVGDIGDNAAARDAVEVFTVPVGRGDRDADPSAYSLTYPKGARDAETLLAHPRTGQLFVVSKGVFAGELYAAPRRLRADQPNQLRPRGPVLSMATDGAFFPDGRHLVLRSYTRAVVYSFPALDPVGELALPRQEQGEAIAISKRGEVLVSSEGVRQWVMSVPLPPELRQVVLPTQPESEDAAPPGTSVSPDAESVADADTESAPSPEDWVAGWRDRDAWPLWLGGGVALGALALWVVRRRRGRG